jgi:hypothetical protein
MRDVPPVRGLLHSYREEALWTRARERKGQSTGTGDDNTTPKIRAVAE